MIAVCWGRVKCGMRPWVISELSFGGELIGKAMHMIRLGTNLLRTTSHAIKPRPQLTLLRSTLHHRLPTMSPVPDYTTAPSAAYLASIDLSSYDPEQSRLMDERCILVDEQDRNLGAADKKTCMSYEKYALSDHSMSFRRPLDGKHQQRLASPSVLRIHLPSNRWQVASTATCFGEDYLP